MLNKKSLGLISLVMTIAIILSSCGGDSVDGANGEMTEENTLVVAQDRDATSLDPHGSTDEASARWRVQIFNNLVKFDEDRNLEGDLAESWEQVDDTTVVFKLREGVKFHNGEELTAEDVKFSLDRCMEMPLVSHNLEDVKEVNIIEDGDIEIKTYEPSAPLMANLALPATAIMNKKAVEEAGEEVGQKPIGTGPYKFVSWKAGDHAILEKNEDYFGEKGKMDFVKFVIVPEGNNRVIGLETGELDIAYEIDPVNLETLEANEELEYLLDESFTVHYMGFNTEKAPFDDERVRQAIAYGIDVDEMLDTVLYNTVKKADSLLNDNVIGSGGEYENYQYNPEKAKELLKEAGYEDGLTVTLMISDTDIRQRNSEVMQAQLKEIGVDLKIEMMEWATFMDKTGKGEHEMLLLASTVSTGDGDNPFTALLHSSQFGDAGNRSFYANEEVDRLIVEGRRELDPEKRVELYNQLQEIIHEELPIYPLYYNNQNAAINKKVKGFKLDPTGAHRISSVYIEE